MVLGWGGLKLFHPLGFLSPSSLEMGRLLSWDCIVELGFAWEVLTMRGPPCGGFSLEGGRVSRTGFSRLSFPWSPECGDGQGSGSAGGLARKGRGAEIPLEM